MNLSEVVIRSTDTFADLTRKVRLAAILGTFQATLTNFRYVTRKWRENCEEEALLGVSLTGIMDHPVLSRSYRTFEEAIKNGQIEDDYSLKENKWFLPQILEYLKNVVIETNKEWASILGINPSTAVTCVDTLHLQPVMVVANPVNCWKAKLRDMLISSQAA